MRRRNVTVLLVLASLAAVAWFNLPGVAHWDKPDAISQDTVPSGIRAALAAQELGQVSRIQWYACLQTDDGVLVAATYSVNAPQGSYDAAHVALYSETTLEQVYSANPLLSQPGGYVSNRASAPGPFTVDSQNVPSPDYSRSVLFAGGTAWDSRITGVVCTVSDGRKIEATILNGFWYALYTPASVEEWVKFEAVDTSGRPVYAEETRR